MSAFWFRGSAVRREPGLNVLLITIDTLRADALGGYGNRDVSTPVDRSPGRGRRPLRSRRTRTTSSRCPRTPTSSRAAIHSTTASARTPASAFPPIDDAGDAAEERGATAPARSSARFRSTRGSGSRAASTSTTIGTAIREPHRVPDAGAARRRHGRRRDGGGWRRPATRHSSAGSISTSRTFPYAPPEPFASQFRESPYLGEVAATDAALGPLLDPDSERRGDRRTLVVLTADHGEVARRARRGDPRHLRLRSDAARAAVLYQPRLFTPRSSPSRCGTSTCSRRCSMRWRSRRPAAARGPQPAAAGDGRRAGARGQLLRGAVRDRSTAAGRRSTACREAV